MDNAIARDERPELAGPNANTGNCVGRVLNRAAPSLSIAPIVESVGRIEYELVETASSLWRTMALLVANTFNELN
jgi:hypothetical protein